MKGNTHGVHKGFGIGQEPASQQLSSPELDIVVPGDNSHLLLPAEAEYALQLPKRYLLEVEKAGLSQYSHVLLEV